MGAKHIICDVIVSTLLKLVSTSMIQFYQLCVDFEEVGKIFMEN